MTPDPDEHAKREIIAALEKFESETSDPYWQKRSKTLRELLTQNLDPEDPLQGEELERALEKFREELHALRPEAPENPEPGIIIPFPLDRSKTPPTN